jgi:hypothetical protein
MNDEYVPDYVDKVRLLDIFESVTGATILKLENANHDLSQPSDAVQELINFLENWMKE